MSFGGIYLESTAKKAIEPNIVARLISIVNVLNFHNKKYEHDLKMFLASQIQTGCLNSVRLFSSGRDKDKRKQSKTNIHQHHTSTKKQ